MFMYTIIGDLKANSKSFLIIRSKDLLVLGRRSRTCRLFLTTHLPTVKWAMLIELRMWVLELSFIDSIWDIWPITRSWTLSCSRTLVWQKRRRVYEKYPSLWLVLELLYYQTWTNARDIIVVLAGMVERLLQTAYLYENGVCLHPEVFLPKLWIKLSERDFRC